MTRLGAFKAGPLRALAGAALAFASTLLLQGALAPITWAGTYEVTACGGGAGSASPFTAIADPQMASYNVCPNTPSNPATGLVTRSTAAGAGASVPAGAGAYQIFEAPPGASLASVSFDAAAIRLSSYWTTGIVAYDNDFNVGNLPYGCYAGNAGCGIGTSAFFGPVTVPLHGRARFRFETRCGNPGRCDISASGFHPGMRALFAAANVRVLVQDFTGPTIVPSSGALWRDGWHRRVELAWQSMTDNVGVMVQRLHVDGKLVESQDYRLPDWPHVRCDFTRAKPCNDILPGGATLDTRTLTDGEHSVRIEAIDAAGNSSSLTRTVSVDNTAPPRVGAGVAGGDHWRRSNGFSVRWDRPSGQVSPIAAVRYSICPTAVVGGCVDGIGPLAGGGALGEITVPAPGEYALRLWLEDAAGNADPSTASDPVLLRFDDRAPEAAFELQDERDPRRVDVRVWEPDSGLAAGTIEIRSSGRRQWHELATSVGTSALQAQVDDTALPDGSYELRAIVRDRAGNERVSDRREDGSRMELTLPLRAESRLQLESSASVKRCTKRRSHSRRSRCRSSRRTARGTLRATGGVVEGRLDGPGGRPVAGARVDVLERPRTGGRGGAAALLTDARGRFQYRSGPGPSRAIRFSYPGTPLIRPASAELQVLAPARTTIAANRRHLRNGQAVAFRGRLLGGPVPRGGKLIDLQAHYRGKWRTFATPRSDDRGRWAFRYRFEATRGLVRYAFRARIRREAAYPYELGYSRTLRVLVRGA